MTKLELKELVSECIKEVYQQSEFVKNYNSTVNEIRVRDNKKYTVLYLKKEFIEAIHKIKPKWSLLVGDKLERQSDVPTPEEEKIEIPSAAGEKIEIKSTSLAIIAKTDYFKDNEEVSSWSIKSLPGVVFYIKYGVQMNKLLNQSSKETGELISTDTEALHECFFVIALASQIDSRGAASGLNSVDSLEPLRKLIDSTKIQIENKEEIIKIFSDRINNEPFSSEVNLRKVDAQKCAEAAYKKISSIYNSPTFDYVTRVFKGSDGKKIVADASIKVAGDILSISLKYKKGQLNNLESTTVMDYLFGIGKSKESGRKVSLMDSIYKFDETKINELLRYFVEGINTYLPPKDKNLRIDNKVLTYPEFKKNVSKNEYYSSAYKTISDDLVKTNSKAAEFVEKYKELKTVNLSGTISRYIEENNTQKTNFEEFLTYTLRCEPDRSYLYVGDGGKSIYTIPSANSIKNRKESLNVTVKPKNTTVDYVARVYVNIGEFPAFEFDVSFRWTKSQWVGDLSQVARNLKSYEINW